MESLPKFRYHPDPIATGSIRPSTAICPCCEQQRGFVYTLTPYVEEEISDLCPWCIADGRAHALFDAEFTDAHGVGGGSWSPVPPGVVEEITLRTPSFSGWQQEQWWTHCHDGAAYLGRVGYAEFPRYPAFETFLREELALPEEQWFRFARALDKEGAPTAYLFQCLHCGAYGGYTDTD